MSYISSLFSLLATPNGLAACAALLSAIATIAAAIAAFRGPISAAQYSEKLRKLSESQTEKRRLKMWIFTIIMQERATLHSPDCVRALNLIDVVFNDTLDVRESWAELYDAFKTENDIPIHVREERTRDLLKKMSVDLSLSDSLRMDDLGRIYYPNSIADENELNDRRRKVELSRLRQVTTEEVDAETNEQLSIDKWPPKPKK